MLLQIRPPLRRFLIGLLIAIALGVYWIAPKTRTLEVKENAAELEKKPPLIPGFVRLRKKAHEVWEAPGRRIERQTFARPHLLRSVQHGQTEVLNERREVIETQLWDRGKHHSSQVLYRDHDGRVVVSGKLIIADASEDLALELTRGRSKALDVPDLRGPRSPLDSLIGKLIADGEWKWWVANARNHSPRNWRLGKYIVPGATLARDDQALSLVFNGGSRAVTLEELALPPGEIERLLDLPPPKDFSTPYRTFQFDEGWLTHVDGVSTNRFFNDVADHRDAIFRAERNWNYQFRRDKNTRQFLRPHSLNYDLLLGYIPVMAMDWDYFKIEYQGSTAALPRIAIAHQILTTAGLSLDFRFGQLVVIDEKDAAEHIDLTGVMAIPDGSEVGRRLGYDLTGVYLHSVGNPIPTVPSVCAKLQERLNRPDQDDVKITFDVSEDARKTSVRYSEFSPYRPKTCRDLLGQVLQQGKLHCTVDGTVMKIRKRQTAAELEP